jgi:glutathione S-transferase
MPDLILHHYPASPFAEKIRLLLGAKSLAWRSVEIPMVMPKPDLVPLTGGYRRTPVLQVGADVYCDTALIVRVIERLHPTPPVTSDLTALSDFALAHFADQQLFAAAVAYAMQPEGLKAMFAGMTPEQMAAFAEDRKKMREGGSAARMPLADAWGVLLGTLARLDGQLADGRRFLTGDAARTSDFSCYHPLWFIRRAGALASIFDPYPHLRGWMGRVEAFGHGSPVPMSAAEALEVARAATPGMLPGRSLRECDGVGVGDEVSVSAVDYGVDPVMGVLANADADAFAVRRNDPRVGEVVVHFPRIGFRIRKA